MNSRVAVVTGAGSGIGRACAIRLAADGFAVVANDRVAEGVEETRQLVHDQGGTCDVHIGDVGVAADVAALVALAVDRHGRLDAMVNNAGYGKPGSIADTDDALIDEMMRVNVKGVLHGIRSALAVMIGQGGGSIVNIASNAGLLAAYDRGAYGAAKSAVMSLTRSAAVENGRYGIRVNAICPGPVDTPALRRFMADDDFYRRQTPMRRLGRPDELAGAVSFLVGPDSTYVSGVSLLVDGALTARLPSPYLSAEHVTA
jgi:NAD(P)-dependent dehydrogenase (short-subunit alcohol dehydrogenase family)